jgi:hypothetical protein
MQRAKMSLAWSESRISAFGEKLIQAFRVWCGANPAFLMFKITEFPTFGVFCA